MTELGCQDCDGAPLGELERVKTRAEELHRVYQYMRGRAPVVKRYPTIWPQYEAAMQRAGQALYQVRSGAMVADDAYQYGRELLPDAIDGLGFWPLIAIAGVGVVGWLGNHIATLRYYDNCTARAKELETQGYTAEQASHIACPERYGSDVDNNLASIVKWGVVGIGGIYLLRMLNNRKPERRRGRERRRKR